VKESRVAEALTKQADTAVSFSELMVEICLPTQGSDPEDVMELERAEEDEDKEKTRIKVSWCERPT